jgi:hypothetical protein
LYEGRNTNENYVDWVDYPPPRQLSGSAAKAQDRVAIKVYKVKDKDKPVISGRFALKYHMIEIQNPALVALIKDILKKEDVHLDVNEVARFTEPFRALYFRYDEIVAKYKTLLDGDALKPHVLLLIRVLDDMFGEIRAKKKSLLASGLVNFKLAWTYFPRDCEVISWGNNCELLCKVVDTTLSKTAHGSTLLVIRGKVMRFNGESFIWEDCELEIMPFEGNKPIRDLPHHPVEFLDDAEAMKSKLRARGRKVLDFQGLTYCLYTGVGIFVEGKNVERHNVRDPTDKLLFFYCC